jgi:large subunit ribosomal protein L1
MASHKRYEKAREGIDPAKAYSVTEAVQMVKERAKAKFDETIEVAINLGVDPRHADQMVRGTAMLPSGTGKEVKVLVFAQGEKVAEAEAAGADFVGLEDYIKQVNEGWLGFDVAIATSDVMARVSSLGRRLGPRGLMPNPKTGTVVPPNGDLARAIRDVKAGRVEFRVDKTSLIHVPIGKLSFSEAQLMENLVATIDAIVRARPSGAKGQYVRSVALCSTMSPSLRLDPQVAQSLKAG